MNMLSKTFMLDGFKVEARDIADANEDSLIALSVGAGWHHRLEDWSFMREVGRGQVAMDETGRAHGVAMWFPFEDQYASIGMVITSPRLQKHGGGAWLTRHILNQAHGRSLGLHATQQSHKLFLSLGFSDEGTVYQYQGYVRAPSTPVSMPDAEVRDFSYSDMGGIRELDRVATGWDRHDLMEALAGRSRGTVLVRKDKIEAFALVRPFGRGMVIGPVIASSEEDARRIVNPLLVQHEGSYLRVDIANESGELASLATQFGLEIGETVTRMSKGKRWPFSAGHSSALWALASQATG